MPEQKRNVEKKPLWLLDVDGVLNAVTAGTPTSDVWPDWQTFRAEVNLGLGYRIWFSPTVTKFISDLHESGKVEVRWLTTWEGLANLHLGPALKLPEFELAGQRILPDHDIWWKFKIAQDAAEDGRPLIWTDDDLYAAENDYHIGEQVHDWLYNRGPTLALSPSSRLGLQQKHLDKITKFIEEN